VSTILDALRKLQRERAAQHPSRDLRGSVTDEIPSPRAPARPARRALLVGVGVLALAVAGGGAWLARSVWLHRSASPASSDESLAAGESAPSAEGQAATEEELDSLERETLATESEMDRATAAEPETPAPVAASPTPAPAPAAGAPPGSAPVDAAAEAQAERERLAAVQAEAVAAAEAQRQAEAAAAARAAAPPPVPVPPAVAPEPAAEVTPPPAVTPAAPPAVTPKAAAAAPKPKASPKPKAKAVAKLEPPRESPEARDEPVEPPAPAAFPPVRVESIRWHPLSERRVASLRFEQQNVSDAHEGDIVAGVLVYRIDPGAVELRIGSTSRVIRPVP
jgi:hypothetical protein